MTKYLTPKTIFGTIALTLLLGVVSSALWDLLFKPGVTEFGRVLLAIVTLGSTTIKDFAYESAALDPTPLPALLVVLFGGWLPLFIVGWLIGRKAGEKQGDKSIEEMKKASSENIEELKEKLEAEIIRLERRFNWIIGVVLIVLTSISITTSSVLNQSIAVWRVFHADLAICAPYLTPLEEKQIRA